MQINIKRAFIKITIYYAIVIGLTFLVLHLYPGVASLLPDGPMARLFYNSGTMEIESTSYADVLAADSWLIQMIFFWFCFLSALLMVIPVGTTYLATRRVKKGSDSLARMILILPVAVTGLVLIVQNSLALAFGLAGIVAGGGIRFRTNMREYTDTLFFLISIGIGLSAGVGAPGLALIMSIVFCYSILILAVIDYGRIPAAMDNNKDELPPEVPE